LTAAGPVIAARGRGREGAVHCAQRPPRGKMPAAMTTHPTDRPAKFASFGEFYPYYLGEHTSRTSRRLHVVGTLLAILSAVTALASRRWLLLPAALVLGYGPAWVGHYFFEHNRPATFRHPLYSLRGDFAMLGEVLTGRLRF
jgi:hypothetical protein